MSRWPTLLLAGGVVCAGLTVTDSTGKHVPAIETRLLPAEVKPAAPEARRLADRPGHDADSSLRDVRLTGVVIGPDVRIAIFAVSGTNPLVLSEGDALKDWRLDSISPDKVVLSGPAGNITLAPKPDANLARPSPPVGPQSDQFEPTLPPGAAVAGPPWPPMTATPIIINNLPPVISPPAQNYPYPEYSTGYDQYYPPSGYYPYPYFYPSFVSVFPVRAAFGFGFFRHHGIHHGGFHGAAFHSVAFHGGGRGRHR